jgi:hypothetical protein
VGDRQNSPCQLLFNGSLRGESPDGWLLGGMLQRIVILPAPAGEATWQARQILDDKVGGQEGPEAPIDTIEGERQMRSISTRIVVSIVALLTAKFAMANPLPQPVSLNVNVIGAQGVVQVNGVPVHDFKQQGPKVNKTSKGTFTDASPVLFLSTAYLLLCTNGDNKLTVEAQITDPKGELRMTLVKSIGAPSLFDRRLAHSGTLNYMLSQSGLPEWTWIKADAVTDGKSELLNPLPHISRLS